MVTVAAGAIGTPTAADTTEPQTGAVEPWGACALGLGSLTLDRNAVGVDETEVASFGGDFAALTEPAHFFTSL